MSIYAIGDLHLSLSMEKPMDRFGGWWINHTETLKTNWESLIQPEDTVILAGDISWALKFKDYLVDEAFIKSLPGKKVIIKGNHDLWWSTLTKMNQPESSITYLHNTFYETYCGSQAHAICGTRGWICPGDDPFTENDRKIYLRELNRLEISLQDAQRAGYGIGEEGKGSILCAIHFPPTNPKHEESGFTELFARYGVKTVVYGHLHGEEGYKKGIKGFYNGVEYKLVSLDYLECKPLLLADNII